jgi:glycosyltransferase involved in cell wall biosynthesis
VRIAIVASPVSPLRLAQLGGAQAFICDLALGLVGRGHDVTLYCAEGSEVEGVRLSTVPEPEDAAAALVMPGGAEPPPTPGVDAAIEAMLDDIRRSGVDAVSQHAFDAAALFLAEGLPVLHTLHLPPIVGSVVTAAQTIRAERLATVSRSCWTEWRNAGVEVGVLLPNGVDDDMPVDGAPSRVALIAGRISPEKGVDHAILAAHATGLEVHVAGAHYDPAYEIDLSDVEVLGSLAREELRRVMARSAVTVCAVRWEEPFGMVAAEAQMAGCPVAGYRRGALPEVVEHGVSGFLAEPDDIDGLAEAIRHCISLDRRVVHDSAVKRLSLDMAVGRYEAALQRVAG